MLTYYWCSHMNNGGACEMNLKWTWYWEVLIMIFYFCYGKSKNQWNHCEHILPKLNNLYLSIIFCFIVNNCKITKSFILFILHEWKLLCNKEHVKERHLQGDHHNLITDWEFLSLLWKHKYFKYDCTYNNLFEVYFLYARHGFTST